MVKAQVEVYKGSGKVKLEIKGGTDAEFAPPVRIQNRVFTNLLREFGVTINVVEKRNGFFPIGKVNFLSLIKVPNSKS